ncbi:unnamed protein product [Prorocentrum cordatum]|uniref:Cellulase n=1 Tax=Prorocentrum cordatum TaxID=2364126 RepID=A0ABN9PPL7_9DINO|nr:unnamed protein product [Polarella glacialis]
MRADRSPFLPLQLPLESDCEPGEVAPARALRAPHAQRARAAAAALSAAAAALALLAVAWRAGPSTGAATLASPEAIIVEAASADANESADPDESDPCSQTGASCAVSKCCSEPGSKCYKKNDYWFACNQTCNPYYMWKDGGWAKTNETVWDCEEIRPPCTPNGESCALSKCCSEPGMKCYKKNEYWSSCNQTCNPNYLWMETGWVKTDDTHWDCEVITIDSTDVSTDSDAGNAADAVASTDSECSPNGESCAQTMCCSEPGAKCYKKNDHWSSCNQTCDPFSLWEVDRWVVTNETVWDCEEIRPPCTPNGASCALSKCCSEPGAKCYKKNDYWSSCNQTCNPNYLWMETGWVKTDDTHWDCEDLTVSPVESADPIADAEAEDEKGTCSQDGASCALSQCCSEPGSKCYKRKMTIGVRATKPATRTTCGRTAAGSRRTRQSGTARRFGRRARRTGRLAHFPSAALSQARSATRRTITGARAIKPATQTTCGWRPAGSRRTRQFGTARTSP